MRQGHCVDHPSSFKADINPLNAELNPICHLLALLGGATIVVVSRLRVKNESIYISTLCVPVGMLLGDFTFYLYARKIHFHYGSLLKPHRNKSDFAALKDDQASLHKIVFLMNEWFPTVATRSVSLDIFFLS